MIKNSVVFCDGIPMTTMALRHKMSLLVLLVFLVAHNFCCSQVSTSNSTYMETEEFKGVNDTTHIVSKNFDEADIQKLKSDPDLNYKEAPTIAESLWDRFLSWINQFFSSLFKNATMTGVGRILMYTVGVIALIVIIMALLKVNAFRVFRGDGDKGQFKYNIFHENIHEMNFEKLIQEAVDKNDFRIATRLIFLFALKLLSEKHLIHWQAGKTNHDYVEEIKPGELKTGLHELSFYFDYAWYGHFNINRDQYQKVYGLFTDWKTKLN
jgi:hypothetical protein